MLKLDDNDICDACTNWEKKSSIDWDLRRKQLDEIVNKYKKTDGSYDCVIPVSGGKDSTFQTYFIKKVCGLNPLAVNLHPLDQTEVGKKNLESLKKIGVDCIEFSPNPNVYQKLARYGLKELGDFQWPEHLGIFTVPVQIAVRYNIPLIVWGEDPQLEYGKPTDIDRYTILDKEWLEKNGGFFLDKIKPEGMTKYGFSIKELRPYLYPNDEDIKKIGVRGIFLGSYIKWDLFKQLELVKTLGFTENESVTYAVRKAIEAAVLELVNKGEEENLWEFKEENEI